MKVNWWLLEIRLNSNLYRARNKYCSTKFWSNLFLKPWLAKQIYTRKCPDIWWSAGIILWYFRLFNINVSTVAWRIILILLKWLGKEVGKEHELPSSVSKNNNQCVCFQAWLQVKTEISHLAQPLHCIRNLSLELLGALTSSPCIFITLDNEDCILGNMWCFARTTDLWV